jgi:putative phosphoesterase
MKVGLISDTHGDVEAWRRAMDLLGSCELILHAGDHLYHGVFNPILESYDPRQLANEMNDCPIPMLHARGNCDSDVDQMALADPIMSPYVFCQVEGLKILITHGDGMGDVELVEMAEGYGVQLVVRGHTHVHGVWNHGSLLVCNPGSPSLPKGDQVPSVGLLEDGSVRVVDLNNGDTLFGLEVPMPE